MIVVVMGVAGSGKTRIGQQLAREIGWQFIDADDLHSASSIEKMAAGVPLTDADREPWLAALRSALAESQAAGRDVVLACSALKQRFRDELAAGFDDLRFVYLRGTASVFDRRLRERAGHFFRPELLPSQFDSLEEPIGAFVIDASDDPERIVQAIAKTLQ